MSKIYRLGDLAEIGRGSSPRPITDQRYFVNGDIPWIKIADATSSGKYICETKEHVNEYGASFSRKLKPNTLIIAASGTLGFPKFLGCEGCIHDGWMYFSDIKTDLIEPDYLYYSLITLRGYYNNLSYGAAIQNINTPIVKKTKIELPALDEQRRVADILSTYDDLIENNNRRIDLLEKDAQGLYKEWFVRFRFPGYDKVEFVEDRPRGWMLGDSTELKRPIHWKFADLSELGTFKRGKNITAAQMKEGNIPVISAGVEPSGLHSEANVNGESLTISASGANAGYLLYHLDDIWAADCSYYQSNNTWFVYSTLKFLQPVISNMQIGSAQPHVYPKNINRLSVVIPDMDIVDMFCERVKPIYKEIKTLKDSNNNLIKQRDLLLPRLMSGKLEV